MTIVVAAFAVIVAVSIKKGEKKIVIKHQAWCG